MIFITQGIVKSKDMDPEEMAKVAKRDPDETTKVLKKAKNRAKNVDLPPGAHDNDRFRHSFVPTVTWFDAFQPDAWRVGDEERLGAFRAAWAAVYGDSVPHKIKVNDPVFQVVSY